MTAESEDFEPPVMHVSGGSWGRHRIFGWWWSAFGRGGTAKGWTPWRWLSAGLAEMAADRLDRKGADRG